MSTTGPGRAFVRRVGRASAIAWALWTLPACSGDDTASPGSVGTAGSVGGQADNSGGEGGGAGSDHAGGGAGNGGASQGGSAGNQSNGGNGGNQGSGGNAGNQGGGGSGGAGGGSGGASGIPDASREASADVDAGSTDGPATAHHDASLTDAGAYDRSGWVATGSPASLPVAMRNPSSKDNLDAKNAIDGSNKTRWSTGLHQVGNEKFTLDFGDVLTFSKVVLLAGEPGGQDPTDVPNAYEVYVSQDGSTWGQAITTGKGVVPASGQPGITTITFPAATARYLQITQTGHTGDPNNASVFGAYWAICEINVYP